MSAPTLPASWVEHDNRVRPYIWNHRLLAWGNTILGITFLYALFITYRALHLEWWLESSFESDYVVWLLYFTVVGISWQVLSFPASLGHHRIEVRHGLSKQSLLSWLWDQVKGLLVGAVLGAIVLSLLFLCVHSYSPLWWVMAGTGLVVFSVVLAQLAPVLLLPLFFKLKPMEEGDLKRQLLKLSSDYGVTVKDVYHLGLGAKTEKGNAAFTGIGRTKRILIGDTLYEKFPAEEVEAVFAHELGHQVNNDLWKGIFVSTFWIYVTFGVADWLCRMFLFPQFQTSPARPFGMLLFFVVLGVVQIPIGVFQAAYSRWREREADQFALKLGRGEKLGAALERLTFQNWGFFRPHALLEFWSYSHPAPWRRILVVKQNKEVS